MVDELAPLDPAKFIGLAAPAPVLLQFGRSDHYVSESQAQAFYAAAREPREIKFYDAGHGLNQAAVQDRQAWLKLHLRLR